MRLQVLCISALLSGLAVVAPNALGAQAADPATAVDQAVAGAWWNQQAPLSALALTGQVRGQMDDLLRARLEESADRAARRQLQQEMIEALVAGDWDAAERKSQEWTAALAEPQQRDFELKVQVLKLLDPAQRTVLHEKFPRLLSRPWLRTSGGGSENRRHAGGQRRGR